MVAVAGTAGSWAAGTAGTWVAGTAGSRGKLSIVASQDFAQQVHPFEFHLSTFYFP